jgi:restriction endonuclease S subunit
MKSNFTSRNSKRELSSLASIRAGYNFRGKVESSPGGKIRVVQTKDISNNGILDQGSLTPVILEDMKEDHFLQDGDIVLRTRGGANFPAATVRDLPFDTVAAAPILIVRVLEQSLLPEYLAWHLNQAKIQGLLQSKAQSSYIPTINKTALLQLTVPLPPIKVQQAIAALHQLAEREIQLLQDISTKRLEFTNRLLLQFAEEGRLPERAVCLLKGPDCAATPSEPRLL